MVASDEMDERLHDLAAPVRRGSKDLTNFRPNIDQAPRGPAPDPGQEPAAGTPAAQQPEGVTGQAAVVTRWQFGYSCVTMPANLAVSQCFPSLPPAKRGSGLPTRVFERNGHMIEPDKIYTPQGLKEAIPEWGDRMQRERRRDGTLPFIRVGQRIFYRGSSISRALAEAEQGGDNDDA